MTYRKIFTSNDVPLPSFLKVKPSKYPAQIREVLLYLRLHGGSQLKQIKKSCHIPPTYFYQSVKNMKTKGYVQQHPHNKNYTITKRGLEYLRWLNAFCDEKCYHGDCESNG